MKKEASLVKPIVKWAGGKTQLLPSLIPLIPEKYNKYIEPFVGGGALFFAINPSKAIISDSNPELINLYHAVANDVDSVINELKKYRNEKELFYSTRDIDWTSLTSTQAAARTIFLNKTCFNGLYRVNKQGKFNTPFGKYKNPNICQENDLKAASAILKKANIICADYLTVLHEYAQPGDFIFLDPPYVAVGKWGDFKRYTKEQFYLPDQYALAREVDRLVNLGCHVILTNSNHPTVQALYQKYEFEIIPTKRTISSKASSRTGEDIIVIGDKKTKKELDAEAQAELYPLTRFMGSKRKLLNHIWQEASHFKFDSVLDLFSGSGVVGYMFKSHGKKVISNDYLCFASTYAKAMIENSKTILTREEAEALMKEPSQIDNFVSTTFKGLYFSNEENHLIDVIRTNIKSLTDQYKRAIAMTALMRACMKKRPRGLFTYTGNRYDDGRKDLKKPLSEQFMENVSSVNNAVFDNGKNCVSNHCDSMKLEAKADMVYVDPPYFTPSSDNDYVRRYHFIEGLARDWQGVEIQQNTSTKKFKNYPSPFSTKEGTYKAFDEIFKKYQGSIIIVSYSSNALPSKEEMIAMLKKYNRYVDIVPIDYTYSFGNQVKGKKTRSKVQEYLFVAYNND